MATKKTSGSTTKRKPTSGRRSPARGRSRASKKARFSLTYAQKALIFGIIIIFSTAILLLSLLAPNQGQLTHWLSSLLWQAFGWGSVIVPVITGAAGLYLVLLGMDHPPNLPIYRLLGLVLLILVFMGFASIFVRMRNAAYSDYWQIAQAQTGGGYLGAIIASSLRQLLGELGAIFTLAVLGIAGAILVSGVTREDLGRLLKSIFERRPSPAEGPNAPRKPIRINPGRSPNPEPVQLALLPEEEEQEASPPPSRRRRSKPSEPKPQNQPAVVVATASAAVESSSANGSGYTWTLPTIADILESGADLDLNNAAIREQVEIIEHTLESFGAPATVVEINQGPTITQFGVEPNYILMRNGRRTKVKVGKIASLSDDLALALAARSIRIQAPVPGKSYVGIEVPNPSKSLVSLRDVMESDEYRRIKTTLALGLGQNVSGQPIAADLATMPHLLIAGTTGSGKSVCVNGIIACLLLQNTPDDLKLVMVDPKRVELTGYNGIPHLAAPVVVEMDRVISTLQWALREMDIRYKKFADVGARHITEYNKKISRRRDAERMPYVVIIIDELADLMMLAPEDTERAVTRLAQMARATGIHMIIATQRPSVDVVTGLIKANFPARIAFAVASGTDSRVILDSTGAERLLGQGDMLFQKPDAPAPLRLQGCFVSDTELQKLITYWQVARRSSLITVQESARPRTVPPTPAPEPVREIQPAVPATEPEPDEDQTAVILEEEPAAPPPEPRRPSPSRFTEEPRQQPLWEALEEDAEQAAQPQYNDELMPEAIAMVRKMNKASTSLLQRRFRIGYTRAARMIDTMEEMGIIGPPTGTSKAREVLPPGETGGTENGAAAADTPNPES